MASIEEILGASASALEKMSDGELELYLRDITNLEPPSLGEQLVGKDECPIKASKKKKVKDGKSFEEQLADLE